MARFLCKKCGNVFQGSLEDKKIKCPRCLSPNVDTYGKIVKRYYKCQQCKTTFKLRDVVVIRLVKTKESPKCPRCGSKIITHGLKKDYLKQSGQMQKHHNTKEKTLFDKYPRRYL